MTKSASSQKKPEQKKNTDTRQDDRNDIFRGSALCDLVDEIRFLNENHVQQAKELNSRYEDIFNGHKYRMMETHDLLKNEINYMKRTARLLEKLVNAIEVMTGEYGNDRKK